MPLAPRPADVRTSVLADVVLLLTLGVWAVGAALVIGHMPDATSDDWGTPASGLVLSVAMLAFSLVGRLVVTHPDSSAPGWVLLAVGLLQQIMGATDEVGPHGLPAVSDRAAIGWIGLLLGVLPLVFPHGFAAPRWRRIGVGIGLLIIAAVTVPVLAVLLVPVLVTGIVALVVRYRRSAVDGRQQVRWLAAGVLVALLSQLIVIAVGSGLSSPTPMWFRVAADAAGLFVAAIPVTIGIAVLRYRLQLVDLIADRALVVIAVATFAAAVYVAALVGLGSAIGDRGNPWLLVLATVVLVVALDPVRRTATRAAHRLVYGRAVDPYRLLTRFSHRVADSYTGAEALVECARTAAVAAEAPSASTWVRAGERWELVATWPDGAAAPAAPAEHSSAYVEQGDVLLGAIAVDVPRLLPEQRRLLRDLATSSAMLFRSVALTADLRARVDELAATAAALRESRARVVRSEDRARTRIERDLHDGAQQRLVALMASLQLIGADVDDEQVARRVDEATNQLREALAELRDLARGIHPRLLVESGLRDAISALVERTPAPVELTAVGNRRLRPELEVAAYYVVAEALTNAVRHAPGAPVTVSTTVDCDRLAVRVRDHGPGGADESKGSGLRGLRDRVEAVGGSLTVSSAPGAGSVVEAVFACG